MLYTVVINDDVICTDANLAYCLHRMIRERKNNDGIYPSYIICKPSANPEDWTGLELSTFSYFTNEDKQRRKWIG